METNIIELRKRFVNDYKLPIPIIYDNDIFSYFLDLYEKPFGALTKYTNLLYLINEQFEGLH